eukprot:TRINITY_DN7063_c0_g1_i1.p1 TRINITY_DN7063_c0_g1~~TRINITY_DN7063_c0_g1_i1.p1  ORF type:complete len:166 (+),score=28.01 TRINITY_DN7063_c0_g1_i1:111-608(+)
MNYCIQDGTNTPPKILFLDVDGVLILFNNRGVFSKEALKQLKRVLQLTGAKVVLSSNWKRTQESIEKLNKELLDMGAETVFGTTPELDYETSISSSRVKEIEKWLDDYETKNGEKIVYWAAVDDLDLGKVGSERFIDHFVITHREKGITPEKAEKLVLILNGMGN